MGSKTASAKYLFYTSVQGQAMGDASVARPGFGRGLCGGGAVPAQQFVDAVDVVVGDALGNLGEPGLRTDGVELGGLDLGIGDGDGLAADGRACRSSALPRKATDAPNRPHDFGLGFATDALGPATHCINSAYGVLTVKEENDGWQMKNQAILLE